MKLAHRVRVTALLLVCVMAIFLPQSGNAATITMVRFDFYTSVGYAGMGYLQFDTVDFDVSHSVETLPELSYNFIIVTGDNRAYCFDNDDNTIFNDFRLMIENKDPVYPVSFSTNTGGEGANMTINNGGDLTIGLQNEWTLWLDDKPIEGYFFASVWFDDPVSPGEPVPEPATIFLLGFGLIGLAGVRRKA